MIEANQIVVDQELREIARQAFVLFRALTAEGREGEGVAQPIHPMPADVVREITAQVISSRAMTIHAAIERQP